MAKRDLDKLTRKELLGIAKVHGIKNRNKMKKAELIKAIQKSKKPMAELRQIEDKLKKEINEKTNETHVIVEPKEVGYVFVNWEVKDKHKEGVLKILEDNKEKFEYPVTLDHGKSYVHVDEDKKIKAVIGVEVKGHFKKVAESNEIVSPTSKKTEGKVFFENIKTLKKAPKGKVKKEEIEKVVESEEKTAKELKYLRYKREGKWRRGILQ